MRLKARDRYAAVPGRPHHLGFIQFGRQPPNEVQPGGDPSRAQVWKSLREPHHRPERPFIFSLSSPVSDARPVIGPDQPLLAQTSPGNAASLRTLLSVGFRPIAGEVLFFSGDRPPA